MFDKTRSFVNHRGTSFSRAISLIAVGLIMVAFGCLGAKESPSISAETKVTDLAPGWKTPITAKSLGIPLEALHFQGAPDSIEGLTIEQVVTDPDTQIRPDASCVECHDWASTATRQSFCTRIDAFMNTDQCGEGPKPKLLKDLLRDWKSRDCPD